MVTCKSTGTATITAKTSNGKTATYQVKVRKIKMVLIGNSKTYRSVNEKSVYNVLNNMIKNRNLPYDVSYIEKGGSSLLYKATNSPYKEDIKKKYEIAVLQEKTAYASDGTDYDSGVKATIDLLLAGNPNVKIYLREGYQMNDHTDNGTKISFDKDQKKANSNAATIANKYGINLIKDGSSFIEYKNQKKKVSPLFDIEKGDNNHASPKGTYLVAACIYKKVTSKNVQKITYYGSLSSTDAKELLSIADKIC